MAVEIYQSDSLEVCNKPTGLLQGCTNTIPNSGLQMQPPTAVVNFMDDSNSPWNDQDVIPVDYSCDTTSMYGAPSNASSEAELKKEQPESLFRYRCTKCSKAFKRGDHLKRHLVSVHDKEHPYRCGDCNKGFPSIDILINHNVASHCGIVKEGPMCTWCKLTFENMEAIEMHAISTHKKQDAEYMNFINKSCNVFGCIFCPKTVSTEKNLIRHMEKMHSDSRYQDEMYSCIVCNVTFESAAKLEKHNAEKHRKNEVKKVCLKKKKSTPSNIQTHDEFQNKNSESIGDKASYVIQNGISSCLSPVITTNFFEQSKPAFNLFNFENGFHTQQLLSSLQENKLTIQENKFAIDPSSVSAALSSALHTLSEFSYDDLSCQGYEYVPSEFSIFQSSPSIPNFHYPQVVQCSDFTGDAMRHNFVVENKNHYSLSAEDVEKNAKNLLLSEKSGHKTQRPSSDLANTNNIIQNSSDSSSADNSHLIAKRGRPKKREEGEIDYESMSFIKKLNDDCPSMFHCTRCNTLFKNGSQVMSHIESVHLVANPQECCICKKRFAQAGNVKRHIRFVHLRERPYQCSDCDSTFDRLCYLQRHMRSHVDTDNTDENASYLNPCNCPECGKRCITVLHLRGHLQRKHYPKSKNCAHAMEAKYGHIFNGIETNGFSRKSTTKPKSANNKKSALKKQPKTTHLEAILRKFDQNCLNDKLESVVTSGSLLSEERVNFSTMWFAKKSRKHQNILPYKCRKCIFRGFASLSFLKSHIAIAHHSTLRRHVCFICGCSYSTKAALMAHAIKRHKKSRKKLMNK